MDLHDPEMKNAVLLSQAHMNISPPHHPPTPAALTVHASRKMQSVALEFP